MRSLTRSRDRARLAALSAEVVALRVTVGQLRAELETAAARSAELETAAARSAELAAEAEAARRAAAAAEQQRVAESVGAGASLQLPLVRLALAREAEPALTREMALALSAPDRGEDTASTEIVLADLPERPLLDPRAHRDREPVDHAAADESRPEVTRRIA